MKLSPIAKFESRFSVLKLDELPRFCSSNINKSVVIAEWILAFFGCPFLAVHEISRKKRMKFIHGSSESEHVQYVEEFSNPSY